MSDELNCVGGDFVHPTPGIIDLLPPKVFRKQIDWSKIPTCIEEGCGVRPIDTHHKYCPFHGHYRMVNAIKGQKNLEDFM